MMKILRVVSKIKNIMISCLLLIIVVIGIFSYYNKLSNNRKVVELYNELAIQTETIEVQDNVYKKQVISISNINDLLDKLSKENKGSVELLNKEIKKKKEKILSLTRVSAKWKSSYESLIDASEEIVKADPSDPVSTDRTKVSFKKDFGYISVRGWTLTSPPQAYVNISQSRPLILTLALTQDAGKRWTTAIAASEKNVNIDVEISSVNPHMLDSSWYERISLNTGLQYLNGAQLYTGATYSFKNGLSLSAGLSTTETSLGIYGSVTYSWNMFRK